MADVQVDFQEKTADVTMQPDKALSKEACDRVFQGSKYAVTSFAESK